MNTLSLKIGRIVAGAVALAALASVAWQANAAVSIGEKAPAFTLPNVSTGAPTSLDALRRGKTATVIMFIATRCPVSNAYNDRMETLATRYRSKHIAFVGINANQTEPIAEVAGHAKDHNFTFPVLKDADDSVANLYDAHVTPEIYVVNADGVVVYHGRIDDNMDPSSVGSSDLANALDDVVAHKTVIKPETKAFGCSIKRAG